MSTIAYSQRHAGASTGDGTQARTSGGVLAGGSQRARVDGLDHPPVRSFNIAPRVRVVRDPGATVTTVQSTIDGHVAVLSLDPAEGRHDRAFVGALVGAAESVAAVASVRVVIVRGSFGTGWANAVLEEPPDMPAIASAAAGIEAVAAIPQPVIAAVDGPAHSAGVELALACDVRIGSPAATFAMPEADAGLTPMGGGTQRLPRAIGRAAALRMLLLGEEIDAAEALRIGLLSRVASDRSVDDAAREIAEAIAERGPLATRMAKEAVHRGSEMTLAQALRYELDLTVLLQSTADRAEGVRAFVERRTPHFEGR